MSDGHEFATPVGPMHYVDRGSGPPVVMVHGNPASSTLFRPLIERLETTHRCLAVDHVGFGRSAKPSGWDHLPTSHAANLASLLDSLDLHDVTMVVNDWGGPIGLSWVLDHPDRVAGLVVTNTWLWSVRRSWYYQGFSRFMGGPVGRYLIRRRNYFATGVVRRAWGTATPLTPEIRDEFADVHTDPEERTGMWVFPREIIGSSEWLASLWERRDVLAGIPMALVWGMRDIAFREDVLDTWSTAFPDASVHRLDDVGHFPAREAPDAVADAVRAVAPPPG